MPHAKDEIAPSTSHWMTALRLASVLTLLLPVITFAMSCNGGGSDGSQPPGFVHFVPNSHAFWSNPANWTTDLGPAYANSCRLAAISCRVGADLTRSVITRIRARALRTYPVGRPQTASTRTANASTFPTEFTS
jgi:hypothetical protein